MRPIFRFLTAALSLVALACFYYQFYDIPHLKETFRISSEHAHAQSAQQSFEGFAEPTVTDVQQTVKPTISSTPSGRPQSTMENRPSKATAFTLGDTLISSAPAESTTPIDNEVMAGASGKAVVMGALSTDDVAWATTKLNSWDAFVYYVDNSSMPHHTDRNKGKEANAYLSFIIEQYESLPLTVAFVHSHKSGYPKAWHTDAKDHSNVNSLNSLNTNFVQKNGYANLRCLPTPGCPDEVRPFREPMDMTRTTEVAFANAWREIFQNDNVPEVIGVACCGQFAVSKEQILKRGKDEYIRMHQWLMTTQLDDDTSGRVFEYLWHIIFGQEAV